MSDERLKRRRFLADALFAGGALGAAALAARLMAHPKVEAPQILGDMEPVKSPTCTPTQEPSIDGDMVVHPDPQRAVPGLMRVDPPPGGNKPR